MLSCNPACTGWLSFLDFANLVLQLEGALPAPLRLPAINTASKSLRAVLSQPTLQNRGYLRLSAQLEDRILSCTIHEAVHLFDAHRRAHVPSAYVKARIVPGWSKGGAKQKTDVVPHSRYPVFDGLHAEFRWELPSGVVLAVRDVDLAYKFFVLYQKKKKMWSTGSPAGGGSL
jgi:hypothetical protein